MHFQGMTPESDTRENTTHVGAHPLPLDVLIIFDILVELDKYGNKSKFDETSRLV